MTEKQSDYYPQDEYDDGASFQDGFNGHLTPKLIVELAAPHTWSASVIPVFFAACLAVGDTHSLSAITTIVLLLISILMQSAVNTINDYFDYVKGADTIDNQMDRSSP